MILYILQSSQKQCEKERRSAERGGCSHDVNLLHLCGAMERWLKNRTYYHWHRKTWVTFTVNVKEEFQDEGKLKSVKCTFLVVAF